MQILNYKSTPSIIDEAKSKFTGKGNDELDKILETYKISEDIFKLSAMQVTLDATSFYISLIKYN